MKFRVTDEQVCVVRWHYEIEAKDEAEALDKYMDGEHGEGAVEIGDSLKHFQGDLRVKEIVEGVSP